MKHYYNPQLLSPEELHEAHLEMAKKYFESKWDKSIYELEATLCEYDDFGNIQEYNIPYYCELTDEQFSKVNELTRGAEGPDFCEALSKDSELLELLADDNGNYPVSICSTPLQDCICMVGVLEPTGQMNTFPYDLLLTKEEYLKLMVIVMDHRDVTFNDLYEYDFDLFKRISKELTSEARRHSNRNKKQSYTLVFSKIEDEVHELLGEEDEHIDLYYENNEILHSVCVYFSEKRMSVVLIETTVCDEPKDFATKNQVLYKIDAEKVLRILDVNSYHEATIILKNRYSCYAAFNKMKDFLDEHKIGYEYLEDPTGHEE